MALRAETGSKARQAPGLGSHGASGRRAATSRTLLTKLLTEISGNLFYERCIGQPQNRASWM